MTESSDEETAAIDVVVLGGCIEVSVSLAPLGEAMKMFDLKKAVCNHGFFMMAPNRWDSLKKMLERPLRLSPLSNISVIAQITQPKRTEYALRVHLHDVNVISAEERQYITAQVGRMLHLSAKQQNAITDFHSIHVEAKKTGFGRIFCSPTLFEDMVKAILLCNCQFGRALDMANSLCELQMEISKKVDKKRKRTRSSKEEETYKGDGNFPSSKELAYLDKKFLEKRCNLGYRATTILRLAKEIEKGRLNLESLEKDEDCEQVLKQVMRVKGIGGFVGSYILTCIGFYHKIPADTETIRHLKEVIPHLII
ncbi:hypothetical protein GIB67_030386 [Kingdonia uniflora]|uniref:Uncharacterized protein n=1 Tax=Kingdonia uniflora TaxID=39325 RepID=A0A7J7NX25_9MAGN|nr:hypothetical protein GIB67_030386 [Kingdonia uniflora]